MKRQLGSDDFIDGMHARNALRRMCKNVPILLTGSRGFIGSAIFAALNSEGYNIVALGYERGGSLLYSDLNLFKGIQHQVVHCGASSSRHAIGRDFYKDNITATMQLIEHIKASDCARLLFFSANSIDTAEKTCRFTDLYTFSKFECENLIKKNLSSAESIVLRLPGIYKRGRNGNGFLDRIFYTADTSMHTIYSNQEFNNLCLIESLVDFTTHILELQEYPGGIYSLGSEHPVTLSKVISTMIGYRADLSKIHQCRIDNPISPVDISKAVVLGFKPIDTLEVLSRLYSQKE